MGPSSFMINYLSTEKHHSSNLGVESSLLLFDKKVCLFLELKCFKLKTKKKKERKDEIKEMVIERDCFEG